MSILDTGSINRTQVRKLAILGFDGPSMASLELFLGKERHLTIVGAEQADLLIVHGDQGKDPDKLQAFYAKKYARPGVLISVRQLSWPGFVLLGKPYGPMELLAALKSVDESQNSGLDAGQHGARAAAVMDLNHEVGSERAQVYGDYKARVDAGQSAMDTLNNQKQVSESNHARLKEKLRRGRDAGKRASLRMQEAQSARQSADEAAASPVVEKSMAASPSRTAPDVKTLHHSVVVEADLALKKALALQEAAKKQAHAAEKKAAEKVRVQKAEERKVVEARAEPQALPEQKVQTIKSTQGAPKQAVSSAKKRTIETRQAASSAVLKMVPEAVPERVGRPAVDPGGQHVKASSDPGNALSDDEMVYRCCGNLADVDIGRPDDRRRIYFHTDGALLYWLPLAVKKAKLSNTPVEIAGLPRLFAYFPTEGLFFGDFGEDQLLQYALSRFGFGELDLKESPGLTVPAPVMTGEKQISEDGDALIWKIALWTARGRLSQGVDPEKVYKLKTRPDFQRMIETPHAMEITELWHERRLSALDIVRILNVPQRFVFAYMSGAYVLGWLQE
ncbi:MAG: hypothetical protein ACPGF7_14985 [Pontibacterium sp.]